MPVRKKHLSLLWCGLLLAGAFAAEGKEEQEGLCPPGFTQSSERGICREAGTEPPLIPVPGNPLLGQPTGRLRERTQNRTVVLVFWGKGCPHCEKEKAFLEELRLSEAGLEVRLYEVWHDRENAERMHSLLRARNIRESGVPVAFIGHEVFIGFNEGTKQRIGEAVRACRSGVCPDPASIRATPGGALLSAPASSSVDTAAGSVKIPFIGIVEATKTPLPLLTVAIAAMDSFNPCAFFVLITLLGLMVHVQSRTTMLLVGGVFVLISGVLYFLFMAAWLNLFLLMGRVAIATTLAGCVSLAIAVINIKDFFLFRRGLSLSIPETAKPKLFDRMRRLLKSASLPSTLAGAAALAVIANSYELLCTAGFPLVFTRMLTLHALPRAAYYCYLALYNVVYVAPLLLIVVLFSATLGKRKLTEREGRLLKLLSGMMMLGLGAVLVVNPSLLNSLAFSFTLLAGAAAITLLAAAITRRPRFGD
jgi:glutaredoxin